MSENGKGLDRLAYQFKTSTKMRAFLQAFIDEFNELQISKLQLLNERYLNTAVGKQLGGIGEIVGLERPRKPIEVAGVFGFEDDDTSLGFGSLTDPEVGGVWWDGTTPKILISDDLYRILLRAKIIKNQTAMTVEDTLRLISFTFGGVKVRYLSNEFLSPTYEIYKSLSIFEQSLLEDLPVLIGIENIIYASVPEDIGNVFSFDGDPDSNGAGFGSVTDPDVGGHFSNFI